MVLKKMIWLTLILVSSGCVHIQTKEWMICKNTGMVPAGQMDYMYRSYSYLEQCENEDVTCYVASQGISCVKKEQPVIGMWPSPPGTVTAVPLPFISNRGTFTPNSGTLTLENK